MEPTDHIDPPAQLIFDYFPALTDLQKQQFEQLGSLYKHWNEQINVISRKDVSKLYLHHVLHSLAIGKFTQFVSGSRILDVGTGGGFPGVPMAILFPEVQFHLVDSIGKKIKVVREISNAIGLENMEAFHLRAEDLDEKYDFVVSRAVTRLSEFYPWVQGKISSKHNNALQNGIIYLKGGDLANEIAEGKRPAQVYPINNYFAEDFFETKSIVYIPF